MCMIQIRKQFFTFCHLVIIKPGEFTLHAFIFIFCFTGIWQYKSKYNARKDPNIHQH